MQKESKKAQRDNAKHSVRSWQSNNEKKSDREMEKALSVMDSPRGTNWNDTGKGSIALRKMKKQ